MGNVKRKQVRAENGRMGSLHAMLSKYPDERSCERRLIEVRWQEGWVCPTSFAEPYPGDDGRFLVHATVTLEELAAQACDPSVVRELAKALEREADRMKLAATDPDEEYDIW